MKVTRWELCLHIDADCSRFEVRYLIWMCKFLDTDDTEYLEAALEAKSKEFSLFGACLELSHERTQHTLRARSLVIWDDTEGQRAL